MDDSKAAFTSHHEGGCNKAQGKHDCGRRTGAGARYGEILGGKVLSWFWIKF